jgi:hypothetical protein
VTPSSKPVKDTKLTPTRFSEYNSLKRADLKILTKNIHCLLEKFKMANSQSIDIMLVGSDWVKIFAPSPVFLPQIKIDRLFNSTDSALSGFHVIGSSEGIEFPSMDGSKGASGGVIEQGKVSCVLLVANNFEISFGTFEKLRNNYNGHIMLIVNNEAEPDRWNERLCSDERVFRYFNPRSSTDAQSFVGGVVKNILLSNSLKSHQLVF